MPATPSPLLSDLVGDDVVVDLASPYVCLGRLVGLDEEYLELRDADLHDFRDSQATREIYVYNAARLGIRRNRARVLVRRGEVVGLGRLADVLES